MIYKWQYIDPNFQKLYQQSSSKLLMSDHLSELEHYKDKIPQFVVKLYHILEQKQYSDYLTWFSDNEILIKNGKKLEDKVLPHFFRHRHISSFIRQLNMYKFSKVNKVTKQKNYMYFKNEHFKRGCIKQLLKIKRNNKKTQKSSQSISDAISEVVKQDASINDQLQKNNLNDFKSYICSTAEQLAQVLKRIDGCQTSKKDVQNAIYLCNKIIDVSKNDNFGIGFGDDNNENKNMLSTMKVIPFNNVLEPCLYQSNNSLFNLNQ